MRPEPRRNLARPFLERILRTARIGNGVLACEPLGDGLRNSNFKLHLKSAPEPLVLRIYEHDPSLCRKESDLMRMLRGSVPVPEPIFVQPVHDEDLPPFAVLRWIPGITYRELKRTGDSDDIAQAAFSAGEILASIGRFTFPRSGWIGPGPMVQSPLLDGTDVMPRFADLCLASGTLQERMPDKLRSGVHALMWSSAPALAALEREPHLVHGDFSRRNLLVRQTKGRWQVAGILDWEFAVAGSPLADFGSFLRYQHYVEAHFSQGFVQAGGCLPPDATRLALLLDLVALCEGLSRAELPAACVLELLDLVRATLERKSP